MSAAENKALIQKVFAELSKGNAKLLVGTLDENARWTVIGTTRFSGILQGKKEIISQLFIPLNSLLREAIRVSVKSFIAENDFVVVEGNGKAVTKHGRTYHNTYCWVFRLANGKILEATEYLDTDLVTRVFDLRDSAGGAD